jgi:hypothetical protein
LFDNSGDQGLDNALLSAVKILKPQDNGVHHHMSMVITSYANDTGLARQARDRAVEAGRSRPAAATTKSKKTISAKIEAAGLLI